MSSITYLTVHELGRMKKYLLLCILGLRFLSPMAGLDLSARAAPSLSVGAKNFLDGA